jgi:galactonate dehydratase
MKIVDVDVYTVDPAKGGTPNSVEYPDIWTFVRIRTDEGVHGWGECTNFPGNGSLMIADAIHHLRPWIIGQDASDINAMWHRIFRKAAYLGPRGLPTAVVSGLDIALWDIKGKVTGRPIYDLLGGKVRPSIPTYANGWFFALDGFPAATTPDEYAAAAKRAVQHGHTVVKCDPFLDYRRSHYSAWTEAGVACRGHLHDGQPEAARCARLCPTQSGISHTPARSWRPTESTGVHLTAGSGSAERRGGR